MSQVIDISDWICEEKSDLMQRLSFTPKETVVGNPRNAGFVSEKKPVYCYSKEGEDTVRIPFAYAAQEYNTHNDSREYTKIKISKNKQFQLREYQKEHCHQTVLNLKQYRTSTLCLPPGKGKTAISCFITALLKYRTVVFVQNTLLMQQWQNEFVNVTDAKTFIVEKNKAIPENTDVIICHIRRFALIPKELRDDIGFLIVDEAHLHCNQQCTDAALSFAPRFLLYCTATPSRSRDDMYVVVEAFVGNNEVKMVENKKMEVLRIKTEYTAEKVKGRNGQLVWATYIQSLLYNMDRNQRIVESVIEESFSSGRKIMVLTTEKKHVTVLYEMFLMNDVSVDWLSGNKKSFKNCRILVGNTQKCGTGFDDANFCEDFDGERISVIWIVSQIGNAENAEQVVGRARDNNPWVRQVVDNEGLAEKHWRTCAKIYKERGAKIKYTTWSNGDDV